MPPQQCFAQIIQFVKAKFSVCAVALLSLPRFARRHGIVFDYFMRSTSGDKPE
jgi:hypothetical protein